jgi:Phosphate transporter family
MHVGGHRGSKGVHVTTWEVTPAMPPSQCGRQSSSLTSSPDHLVRLEKERWGNREAEGLGGLEVDDQFELRHVITGAIVEVGAITKLSAVRWGMAGRIVWAWLLTIPAAAGVASTLWYLLSVFGV